MGATTTQAPRPPTITTRPPQLVHGRTLAAEACAASALALVQLPATWEALTAVALMVDAAGDGPRDDAGPRLAAQLLDLLAGCPSLSAEIATATTALETLDRTARSWAELAHPGSRQGATVPPAMRLLTPLDPPPRRPLTDAAHGPTGPTEFRNRPDSRHAPTPNRPGPAPRHGGPLRHRTAPSAAATPEDSQAQPPHPEASKGPLTMPQPPANLSELAAGLTDAATAITDVATTALRHIAEEIAADARARIGREDQGWPPLSPKTIAQKQAAGFGSQVSPTDPLLRTGEMRDSIGVEETAAGEISVGSSSPLARIHEEGTAEIPPRPFLGPAAQAAADHAAEEIGRAAAEAIRDRIASVQRNR